MIAIGRSPAVANAQRQIAYISDCNSLLRCQLVHELYTLLFYTMCATLARCAPRHFELRVGGARYMARPMETRLGSVEGGEFWRSSRRVEQHDKEALITVISTTHPNELEDENWLEEHLKGFRELKDDVWTSDFLEGLLIGTVSSASPPSQRLLANIRRRVSWHACVQDLELPVRLFRCDLCNS